MRFWKSAEERAAIRAARERLERAARELASDTPEQARARARALATDTALAALSDDERRRLEDAAFTAYAETVLADGHLTADEEAVFMEVADALGVPAVDLSPVGARSDVFTRLMVAKLNDGRLETIDSPRLIPKPGEVVHAETEAALLEEVAVKEFRGGSSGVSFRVAKGVRFHVGGLRARSVVVGNEIRVEDTGPLSITSTRAVFLGDTKTLEFLYTKLAGMEVFDDGIRLQVTNRQAVSLLRLNPGMGNVIAATINAAMQPAL